MPKGLFGGGSSFDYTPITSSSVRTPALGISSSLGDDGSVSSRLRRLGSPEQAAFDQRFPRILSDIDTLRGTIRPGFSDLREARLRQVANARSRGMGDLRENLRRRRVAGSSFANDTLTRAEAEFGQQAADQEALSFLEELNANQQLLAAESTQLFSALERELAEAGLAANFASNAANLFSQNQMFAANLAAQEAAAEGEFFGDLLGLAIGAGVSLATGNPFAGGAAASAASGAASGGGLNILGGGSGFRGRPADLAVLR